MTFKTRLYLLLLLFASSLLILSAGTYVLSNSLINSLQSAYAEGVSFGNEIDSLRKAQVAFQRQVQEWKNSLLRGADQDDKSLFDKHWTGFIKMETEVRNELSNLKHQLQSDRINEFNAQIDDLLGEHSKLGEKYREAISTYDRNDPTSYLKVDKTLRGIDRPASSKMDKLAENIETFVTAQFHERKSEAGNQASVVTMIALIGAVCVIVIGSLVSMYAVYKLINIIGGEPEFVADVVREIASGNLNLEYEVSGKSDESLLSQVGIMQLKLKTMIRSISMSASDMRRAITSAEDSVKRIELPDDLKFALDKKIKVISSASRAMEVSVERFVA